MKILSLTLHEFKGIKDLTITTNGGDIAVFGDNGTGKTTVFDAFQWLLFGKDSQNRSMDDQIKYKGQLDHGVDHEVEALLTVKGKQLALKRIFHEKWTKARGSATKEFGGHETLYFIDGVPSKKKEYEAKIGEIADESIFKLLTNPLFFNEQMHWQKRREILLQVCGDISDTEVIDHVVTVGNKDMLQLLTVLNAGRTIDDHRKVIKVKQTAINKELNEIPSRIDEVQRGLPDTNGIFNSDVIEVEIDSLKKQKGAKEKEIIHVQNGGEIANQETRIRQIEGRMQQIINEQKAAAGDQTLEKKKRLADQELRQKQITNDLAMYRQSSQRLNSQIESLNGQITQLRNSWHERNNQEFVFDHIDVCPTCSQVIPAEQISEAREKAQADFNQKKSNALLSINKDGKMRKEELDILLEKQKELNESTRQSETKLQEVLAEITALSKEIEGAPSQPDPTTSAAYQEALKEKRAIESHIEQLKVSTNSFVQQLQNEINLIDQDISARQRKMALLDQYKKDQVRISELKLREKELTTQFEALEKELYLTEEFIRSKVSMMEERINSKFKYARFKLFKQQINGGLEECCETLGDGVPYSAGLNNAARINVGIDIINTLSEFYQFEAPIFVDNAEAVTKLATAKAQVIRLVVSPDVKSLRIEQIDQSLKEAV